VERHPIARREFAQRQPLCFQSNHDPAPATPQKTSR
jgi:hypothetical protein